MKNVLRSIRIKDFALIRQLEIEFSEGLTVFSGETGAGKSVIVDAVSMIMGMRASADYIRSGCDRFIIDAAFELKDDNLGLFKKLSDIGVEPEDGMLIVSREYHAASRNTCRVNGRPVTLAQLRMLTENLIEIHGQNENQSLLVPSVQLGLLDELAGKNVTDIKAQLADTIDQMQALKNKRDALGGDEAERKKKIDYARFELDEIAVSGISTDEETTLREEKEKLANYSRIISSVTDAFALLRETDDDLPSLRGMLAKCAALIEHAAQYDGALAVHKDNLITADQFVEETASFLDGYLESADFDPKRLELIDDRLYRYAELKRKYGEDVPAVLAYADKMEDFLFEQENASKLLRELDDKERHLLEVYNDHAYKLHALRVKAAQDVESRIIGELDALALRGACFKVQFHENTRISDNGFDTVEYLVSTNPGEAMKNMARIASGGEISRIMLALRVILAGVGDMDTMIFDEVDAGIGGRTAQAVAEKLYFISRDRQVFCVTHSPQIAAFADFHVGIRKLEMETGVHITATQLSGDVRSKEIARMIAGAEVTEMSMLHAGEMLQLAAGRK